MGLLWKDRRNRATISSSFNFFFSRKEKGDKDEALCYLHYGKELVLNRVR